jgi:hypothetical protein
VSSSDNGVDRYVIVRRLVDFVLNVQWEQTHDRWLEAYYMSMLIQSSSWLSLLCVCKCHFSKGCYSSAENGARDYTVVHVFYGLFVEA